MAEAAPRDIVPFLPVHPLYEKLRHLRGSIILIEGIIGAGKSTLGASLHKALIKAGIASEFFEENVDPKLLELFLADKQKYAFAMQTVLLVQRQKTYMKAIHFARHENGVSIVDRSLYGDIAFAKMHYRSGRIDDREWAVYESLITNSPLSQPSYILYLDVTSDVALSRIRSRNRGSEASSYNIEYLDELSSAYKDAMSVSVLPISVLDWNKVRTMEDDSLLDEIIAITSS